MYSFNLQCYLSIGHRASKMVPMVRPSAKTDPVLLYVQTTSSPPSAVLFPQAPSPYPQLFASATGRLQTGGTTGRSSSTNHRAPCRSVWSARSDRADSVSPSASPQMATAATTAARNSMPIEVPERIRRCWSITTGERFSFRARPAKRRGAIMALSTPFTLWRHAQSACALRSIKDACRFSTGTIRRVSTLLMWN